MRVRVLGLWFGDGEPAGIGIFEDEKMTTADGSKFIPHPISDGPVNYERQPVPDIDESEVLLMLEQYEAEDGSTCKFGSTCRELTHFYFHAKLQAGFQ